MVNSTVSSPTVSTSKNTLRKLNFGPQRRIRHRNDFLRVQSNGSKHSSKHFLLSVAPRAGTPNGLIAAKETRLGLTVTKKVDKLATRRNTLKRRLRECFRKARPRFQGPPMDLVVIARDRATECDYEQVRKEFQYLLYQAEILQSKGGPAKGQQRPKSK